MTLALDTRLGHSEAKVEVLYGHPTMVIKTGPGVRAQAEYMRTLGPDVCADVYSIGTDSYIMERLTPPEKNTVSILIRMRTLLERNCWCRYTPYDDRWMQNLVHWCNDNAPLLHAIAALARLYPIMPMWNVTHGDATAANCMMRGGQLVTIDAMPFAGKIPMLIEVDLGKMLQSALGWEHVLDPTWPQPPASLPAMLLEQYNSRDKARAWWWCAVAMARIAKRATRNDVRTWANAHGRIALAEMQACYFR